MMMIALTQPQETENLQLEVNISATLGITAEEARRKVNRFLMDNVSMFLSPSVPLLVVESQEKIYWRFPIGLILGQQGYLGQVGEVDVDAYTGELLLDGHALVRIEANAQRLAQSTSHPPVS
jgi:hypothetical protein